MDKISKSVFVLDENYKEIQKDLKPCHHCGAKPKLIFPNRLKHSLNHPRTSISKIQCACCGAFTKGDTMYQAINNWNDGYVIPIEPGIIRGNITYIDDDPEDLNYFIAHICHAHSINGESVYTY